MKNLTTLVSFNNYKLILNLQRCYVDLAESMAIDLWLEAEEFPDAFQSFRV